jgi:DinB superfamily
MPRRPSQVEFGPPLAGYIARIEADEDVLAVLEEQLGAVPERFGKIPESRGGFRYAPDKWSIKDIVAHLSDVERVFSYRALRFARGDTTALPGFDQDAYAPEAGADRRTLADLVAEWGDVRRATLALFRHLPEPAWDRRGTASGHPASVRALAYAIAGHVRHHFVVLEERYQSPSG